MSKTLSAEEFEKEFDQNGILEEGNTNQDDLVHSLIRNTMRKLDVNIENLQNIRAMLETVNIFDLVEAVGYDNEFGDYAPLHQFSLEIEQVDPKEILGEKKISAGDWVREHGNIYQFVEPSSEYSYQLSLRTCVLWVPRPGEVIVHNKHTGVTLERWTGSSSQQASLAHKNIQPFIGKNPTYLKDEE